MINAAIQCGKGILDIYELSGFATEYKDDDSTLTKADLISNAIINS